MVHMMPVSEMQTRIAKLKEVKHAIDDSQHDLADYIERVNGLIDWAERECGTLTEQLALHKADRAIKK